MSMVTSPRPALCRTVVTTAADRRRALRLLLKPMSCCGILGKKSKRSSPDGREAPPPSSSWACASTSAASGPAVAAAQSAVPAIAASSGCLPSSCSIHPQPHSSTGASAAAVATAAADAAAHETASGGSSEGGVQLLQPLQRHSQHGAAAAGVAAEAADAVRLTGASPASVGLSSASPGDSVTVQQRASVLSSAERGGGGGVQLIAAEALAALLGAGGGSKLHDGAVVSLLDCRAFMSYNHDHIRGAINVSCTNKCAQKRIRHGRVGDFITSGEGKEQFRSSSQVVVYDDATVDLGSMTDMLSVLVTALLKESKAVHVLKGGMNSFREQFHSFCETSQLAGARLPAADHGIDPISGQLTLPRSSPHAVSRSEALDEAASYEANGSSSLLEYPPSAILSFLYIGNESDASNLDSLKQLGVTHVLNATTHAPCTYEHSGLALKYKRLPVKDTMQQSMQPYFSEAIQFIEDARASGGRVLVHCHAGVSRSATLAIAYLLSRSRLSTLEAYEYVKRRRRVIAPNINFMGQLLEYEQSLSGGPLRQRDDSLQLDPL